MTSLRNSALMTGLVCLALTTASCSGSSDGAKDTAAAPAPSQPPAPFDCAKILTKQDAENVLKKPAMLSRASSNPPKACAYIATEAGDHAKVSVGQQMDFPPVGVTRESFEGHDARRWDDTKANPMSCRLFVDLGDRGGGVLSVIVYDVKGVDMCGIVNSVAHLALSRLPQNGS